MDCCNKSADTVYTLASSAAEGFHNFVEIDNIKVTDIEQNY